MSAVALKHLCAVPPAYGLNISPDRYRDEGIRLLRTSDITDDGALDPDAGVFVDVADVPLEMRLRTGDVLFSRSGTVGRAFLFDEVRHGPATYAGFLVRFRLRDGIDPRAIRYWSDSAPFIGEVTAGAVRSTILNFNAERYADLEVPAALVSNSRVIADYLDAETARIDALVGLRRAVLGALAEREQSAVERMVLGADHAGRNSVPSRAFRTRPVDWPETTLRHLSVEVQTGPFGSQLHSDEYVEGGVPIINPMHLVDGTIVPTVSMSVTESRAKELARHRLEPGDVVVARRGELGRVAVVDSQTAGCLCGTGCLRLRPGTSPLDARYLALLLSTTPLRAYFEQASVGSTMDNLSAETLLAAPVLLPPSREQAVIVEEVRRLRRSSVRLSASTERQIDLLLERRQTLITAAVTGQPEIPGVAA